jgi:hypothetical protein
MAGLVVLVGAALLATGEGPSYFLVPRDGYVLTGAFIPGGAYTTTVFHTPRDAEEPTFGSWAGADSNTGTFTTKYFRAPHRLTFCLSGYPNREGISLYLEDLRHRRLTLKTDRDPGEEWTRFAWSLPSDWRDDIVQLVADDQARGGGGWIGVTLPREGGAVETFFALRRAIAMFGGMGIESVLFVLPGFALAFWLQRRFKLDPLRFACLAFAGSALAGYLCFWLYFANVTAGEAGSILLIVISCAGLGALARRRWRELPQLSGEFRTWFLLAFLTGLFYLGLGYMYPFADGAGAQAEKRILWQLPPDNVLPYMFSERLYLHQPVRPYLFDVWKASDRPPLQTGISLEEYPLWQVFSRETDYQLLAVFLQSTWAGSLWLFLRFAGVRRRVIVPVLGLCVFSGFFFLHSYYVWPKLLATALFLVGLSFSPLSRPDYKWNWFDTTMASAAITLGLLSHTGVAFTILGVAWVILRAKNFPALRVAVCGLAALLILWLPWMAYQKLYDPPGDLLLKLHFAGSLDQQHGFWPLLKDAYGKLSAVQYLEGRIRNVAILFIPDRFSLIFSGDWKQRYDTFMAGNFFCLFQALGILNLGLLARLDSRKYQPSPQSERERALADRCAIAALISVAVWCVSMYTPGGAVIHQGSLLNVVLLFVALGIWTASLLPRLAYVLIAIQAAVIFPIFVFGKPFFGDVGDTLVDGGILDRGFAAVTLLPLAGMLLWGWRTSALPESELTTAPSQRS